jgi:hypothetical protein
VVLVLVVVTLPSALVVSTEFPVPLTELPLPSSGEEAVHCPAAAGAADKAVIGTAKRRASATAIAFCAFFMIVPCLSI